MANVSPVYKKGDGLLKKNYRPVSILPTISKIFEQTLSSQLTDFFENIFSPFLSAFTKGYSCQSTLIKLVEDWKKALNNELVVGAVLMDLSKAFDCLPHDLLIEKLRAYGLDNDSANLMSDYLSNRFQRVKTGNCYSTWLKIIKGVPQGSILGPFLFNIFINDIFYWLKKCNLYNYADDNTLSFSGENTAAVKSCLEAESVKSVEWFKNNYMLANPHKFQAIFLNHKRKHVQENLNFGDVNITSEEHVKLLGVELDDRLSFDHHISDICRKAATQLNVLRRLSSLLDVPAKLAIFRSFILSNFKLCPVVWHYCGKVNSAKLEKIQERGLRFVYSDLENSYEYLCKKAGMSNLHVDRTRLIAIEVFKAVNKLSPIYMHDLFKLKVHLTRFFQSPNGLCI